jgi:hypothetical protein
VCGVQVSAARTRAIGIGVRDFDLHGNCVSRIREIAKSDLPICEKEIAEEYPVGDEDSREELEELGLFGPDLEKVLVRAGRNREGWSGIS